MKNQNSKLVGVIPAAGFANRISPLPCSKEIYPAGFYSINRDGLSAPRVISSYLLEYMKEAGVKNIYMVIRKGKWDIPDYFGDGSMFGVNFAYIVTEPTPGTPYTVDKSWSFINEKKILFGFPDIYYKAKDAFGRLLKMQKDSNAEIVLGLFKANNSRKMDMVEVDQKFNVISLDIKPEKTKLKYTWLLACWTPVFTRFLHTYLSEISEYNLNAGKGRKAGQKELFVGDIFNVAITKGMNVKSVFFEDGIYRDIGTIEDLKKV